MMDAMTFEEDQSCHALNAAWMQKTASSTMARARLACVGGSPSGFQQTNTSIDPTKRTDPKPLKKYPIIVLKWCVGAGEGVFFPYSVIRRFTCSVLRPLLVSVERRRKSSSRETVCHSRSKSSASIQLSATVFKLLRGACTIGSGVFSYLLLLH